MMVAAYILLAAHGIVIAVLCWQLWKHRGHL